MAGLQQRVAFVERRMDDHATVLTDLRTEMRGMRVEFRTEIRDLRSEMDRRFDRVDQKFTWLVGMFVALLLGLVSLSVQVSRLQL
jgi:hypothetical protein